jgi:hypothetical protein
MEYHMLVVVVLLPAETKAWFAELVCHYIKRSFIVSFLKFIGINKYIQIIFVGPKTHEYKIIFVGLSQALMNIWTARFDFD